MDTIAKHPSSPDFGIAILTDGATYLVARYGRRDVIKNRYVGLSRHNTEAAARTAANTAWAADHAAHLARTAA